MTASQQSFFSPSAHLADDRVNDAIADALWGNRPEARTESVRFDQPPEGPGLTSPQFQTLQLPGMGDDTPEQMPLFDTHRVGKQEYYQQFRSPDATDWRDKPAVDAEQLFRSRKDVEPMYQSGKLPGGVRSLDATYGAFHQWKNGPEEKEFLASDAMHGDLIKSHGELGHSGPPKLAPLQFNELQRDENLTTSYDDRVLGETTWSTPSGTPAAKVEWEHNPDWHEPEASREMHDDPLGTLINTAEVHPLYKGRGYSKGIMADLGDSVSDVPGILHADGFTDEGARAFNVKGAPLDEDVREWRNQALSNQGVPFEQPYKNYRADGSSQWQFPKNETWGLKSAQWKRQMAEGQQHLIAPLRASLGLPNLNRKRSKAFQDPIPGI